MQNEQFWPLSVPGASELKINIKSLSLANYFNTARPLRKVRLPSSDGFGDGWGLKTRVPEDLHHHQDNEMF